MKNHPIYKQVHCGCIPTFPCLILKLSNRQYDYRYTRLISYSIPSDLLEIGIELTMEWTTLWTTPLIRRTLVNKLVPWCAWLLSGALEIPKLRYEHMIESY